MAETGKPVGTKEMHVEDNVASVAGDDVAEAMPAVVAEGDHPDPSDAAIAATFGGIESSSGS